MTDEACSESKKLESLLVLGGIEESIVCCYGDEDFYVMSKLGSFCNFRLD